VCSATHVPSASVTGRSTVVVFIPVAAKGEIMSDTSQGVGWWRASDAKWYPPSATSAPQMAPPTLPPPPQGTLPTYNSSPAPPPTRGTGNLTNLPQDLTFWLMIAGAVALFFGSFLPWANISFLGIEVSKSGTSGDGVFTLILAVGVGIGAALLKSAKQKPGSITALVCAGLAGLVALINIIDIGSRFGDSSTDGMVEVTIGFGLGLVALGAAVAFVGSLLELINSGKK